MTPTRLRALVIGVGALVVAATIGLIVSRGGSSAPSSVRAGSGTTTTTSEDTTTTTSLDDTTTTIGASTVATKTTTRVTAAARTTAPPTTAAPGAVHAPAPGTYRYAKDQSGSGGNTHNEYTMAITAAPDEGGATRRNVAINGTPTDEQAWGSDVVRSLRQPGTYPCTWNPARTLYLGTLSVNATWTIDSRCAKTTAQYPETDHEQAKYTVTGRDGSLWVIHFKEHFTNESGGQTNEVSSSEGDIRFDAQRGLVVRRQETMTEVDLQGPQTIDTRLL